MRVVREEIFGPVAAIMPFDDEDEVVAAGQRHRVRPGRRRVDLEPVAGAPHGGARSRPARSGSTPTARCRPMSPRQGFKNSGVGVEHGTETIKEYTRLKSVWINTSEEPVADPFIMRS